MAKITQGFSYTFQPGNGQWSKINLEVEVDTELPLDIQLQQIKESEEAIWEFLKNKVDNRIEEIANMAQGGKS
jgi:hypothetical protein